MNSTEAQSVAVIFEMDAREKIMKLAAFMPVWAIDSTANAKAIDDARQQHQFPLTIFFAHPGESRMDMFSRVLFDVDEHHQCGTFDVYGASERDIDPAAVTELNIHRVRETDYGFQLIR
ncbi:hypothetical protein C8234_14095 [Paracidovorax avenae]|nr:hypothetical protein [Paracidovorax avenae]AVS79087.1 hypothetical protein C8234_14095 [Paracidovorax avenae]